MTRLPELTLDVVSDLLLDAICIVDTGGHFLYISAAGERIFGYPAGEMLGRNMFEFIHPGDHQRTRDTVADIMAGRPRPYFENRYVRKDGSTAHIMWSARWSADHQFRIAVARDITERKRTEARQAALYAIADAANLLGDPDQLFERIRRLGAELFGVKEVMVALRHPDTGALDIAYRAGTHTHDQPARALAGRLLEQNLATATGDGWLAARLGSGGALLVQAPPGSPPFGEADHDLLHFMAAQLATAMERKQMLQQLEHMARFDPLTDLPNRALFLDRLHTALRHAQRERGLLAVLYLDLDKFKQVNDRHGHHTGDQLLQQVARRLVSCVREADTVARLGGDEFVVLLEDLPRPEAAAPVADKIRAALSAPYTLPAATLHITPSLGMALFPEHGLSGPELMARADGAMYRAKRTTKEPPGH